VDSEPVRERALKSICRVVEEERSLAETGNLAPPIRRTATVLIRGR